MAVDVTVPNDIRIFFGVLILIRDCVLRNLGLSKSKFPLPSGVTTSNESQRYAQIKSEYGFD